MGVAESLSARFEWVGSRGAHALRRKGEPLLSSVCMKETLCIGAGCTFAVDFVGVYLAAKAQLWIAATPLVTLAMKF